MNLLSILDGTPEPPIIDLHLENINESGEYDLPTPMYEFQKELTDQIVSLHYPDILKYCETNDTKELIIKSLEICINNCMLVSTHPYLLINHYMPKNLALKDMSNKLADTSGKFHVLRDLINVIIKTNSSKNVKNVGIVMNNTHRFFDLAEALLLGCTGNKSIKRYIGNHVRKESTKANKNNNGNDKSAVTNIHLLPHDGEILKHQDTLSQTKFEVLIVFDGSVDNQSDFFKGLRNQNRRGEAIVIRLVPMRTIEHCKLYYSKQINEKNYLYKLISSIVCLRDQIGNLPPDIFPIYNQGLTYLSTNFFESVFKSGTRGLMFPAWPLPELPSIPKFSETDVERSLLTEVHFHYTPYDSADNVIDYVPVSKKINKVSYYESKRLELDYITNPLRNDFNRLLGILSNDVNFKSPNNDINKFILTHRLIMQLNNAYLNWDLVQEEYIGHLDYNETEKQEKSGRRTKEYNVILSKFGNDIDHAEQRIQLAEKQATKKTQEIDDIKEANAAIEKKISNFVHDNNLLAKKDSVQCIENQNEIWKLRSQIKDYLIRIKAKNDEKTYMSKEYSNALTSKDESLHQIEELNESNNHLKRKIHTVLEVEDEKNQEFKKQKSDLLKKIESTKLANEALKKRLGKSLKFLKDTSHLKKRKGRGITPSQK